MKSWYIKSYTSTRDHPKTRKLARLLGVSRNEARGLLHCLWWWALSYAEDGSLGRYGPEEIADACDWESDPEKLQAALIEAGFLEVVEEGLILHDWDDYAGELIRKREAEKDRSQRRRNSKKNEDTETSEE